MTEQQKQCPVCQEFKPLTAFQQNPDGSIRKHTCKSCYGQKYRSAIRLEAILALGSRCACCGEKHPSFLSLDHINNDGGEHRSKYTSSNNTLIYADARREGWPTDKYQLLCYNCHSAKSYKGQCPHEIGETAEEGIAKLRGDIFHTGKQYQNFNLEPLKLGPLAKQERSMSKEEMMKQLLKLMGQLSEQERDALLSH